jgi:hypothetical protein
MRMTADLELGKDSSRGRTIVRVSKYWKRMSLLDERDIVDTYYSTRLIRGRRIPG